MAQTPKNNCIALSDLAPGETGRIVSLRDISAGFRLRLTAMGLTQGAKVTLIRRAPLGDPLQFHVRGSDVCLRQAQIQAVVIERCL